MLTDHHININTTIHLNRDKKSSTSFTILYNKSHLFNDIINSSNKYISKRSRGENSNRINKGSSSTNVDDRVTIEDGDFEDIERELEFFNDPNDAKTPPAPFSPSE
ncbi:hypothetical protein BCR42DRAFT_400260 [Absidia repens]|uniref:Uncharacterized protein n=1 Tax=Absidia repens TaxID=90262 RepID=A0A1X2J144_9FUNG|nr:hypothetical protein BCR42DRAFT_400260 [Absidia repens]